MHFSSKGVIQKRLFANTQKKEKVGKCFIVKTFYFLLSSSNRSKGFLEGGFFSRGKGGGNTMHKDHQACAT